jgi:hypothetical protein
MQLHGPSMHSYITPSRQSNPDPSDEGQGPGFFTEAWEATILLAEKCHEVMKNDPHEWEARIFAEHRKPKEKAPIRNSKWYLESTIRAAKGAWDAKIKVKEMKRLGLDKIEWGEWLNMDKFKELPQGNWEAVSTKFFPDPQQLRPDCCAALLEEYETESDLRRRLKRQKMNTELAAICRQTRRDYGRGGNLCE